MIEIPIADEKIIFNVVIEKLAGFTRLGMQASPPEKPDGPIRSETVLSGNENTIAIIVETTIPRREPGIFFVNDGAMRIICNHVDIICTFVFVIFTITKNNRTGQNRTVQNRTEQNKTKQNRTERNRKKRRYVYKKETKKKS